jgi:hypothetical protein
VITSTGRRLDLGVRDSWLPEVAAYTSGSTRGRLWTARHGPVGLA